MRPLKLVVLVFLFCCFLLTALCASLAISLLRLPRRRIASRLMRCYNRILRLLLNLKINVEGARDRLDTGGHYIVSNHFGYLDGIVLGSLFPVIFVTKQQVKRWPVIGQLLALLETVFVDRENTHDVLRVIEEISRTLKTGANVLVFPEGTSTNGEKLLPFQSSFFAAPLSAGAPVVPVTIAYRSVDEEPLSPANRDRVYWYGDMTFAPHLWDLLATRRVEVAVKVHPRLETVSLHDNSQGRKQLSQCCYEAIAREMNAKPQTAAQAPRLLSPAVRQPQ